MTSLTYFFWVLLLWNIAIFIKCALLSCNRGVRGIFFWGGKVIFPNFFPGVKCFFPVENPHFGSLTTNFSGLKSELQKSKKQKTKQKQKTNKQTKQNKTKQTKTKTKQNKNRTNKQTKNKTKTRSSAHFVTFLPSIFNFPPPLFQFSFFSAPFFFFPCLSFPDRSAKISPSEVSGATFPPAPPVCYATGTAVECSHILTSVRCYLAGFLLTAHNWQKLQIIFLTYLFVG